MNQNNSTTFTLEDVRNKLGPIQNLITMIENGLMEGTMELQLLQHEIEESKKAIKYLTKK